MIPTFFGALVLFIPLLIVGAWFLFNRYRPVFWMYLGAVVVGLGYLATVGSLQTLGQPVYNLVYGPKGARVTPTADPAPAEPVATPSSEPTAPAVAPPATTPEAANDNAPDASDAPDEDAANDDPAPANAADPADPAGDSGTETDTGAGTGADTDSGTESDAAAPQPDAQAN